MSNLTSTINALQNNKQITPPTIPQSNTISYHKIRTNLDKKIALTLKTTRKAQNLTQNEVAIKAHLSRTTVHRAETNYVSLWNMIKIAHALNLELTLTPFN